MSLGIVGAHIPGFYFADGFTRADNTVALGAPWTNRFTTIGVLTNRAYTSGGSSGIASVNAAAADAIVEALFPTLASQSGFCLRVDPAANSGNGGGYLLGAVNNAQAQLHKITNLATGATSLVGTYTTGNIFSSYSMRMVMTGTTFHLYVNGNAGGGWQDWGTKTDATYSGTHHGLWLAGASTRADDFQLAA